VWGSDKQDKWELLPAFLKVKGLVKQHLDSFNHFVNTEIHQILQANQEIVCENNKHFIRYLNIYLSKPERKDNNFARANLTPMECRLTDSTYAARIYVDIEYTRETEGKERRISRGIEIGMLPVMLRSDLCHLKGKDEKALARMGECPLDPGGYFVVRGTEKVILVQEQMSKNRIIVMKDAKKEIVAEVTS
jgi:DNA-directed RNA polymerase III subunit RPC2